MLTLVLLMLTLVMLILMLLTLALLMNQIKLKSKLHYFVDADINISNMVLCSLYLILFKNDYTLTFFLLYLGYSHPTFILFLKTRLISNYNFL